MEEEKYYTPGLEEFNVGFEYRIMENKIKELRIKIDGLAQLTKELKEDVIILDLSTIPNNQTVEEWMEDYRNGIIVKNITNTFRKRSKETEKATDSLYLAKAWLGKVLGKMGTENPYKSGYKTKEDIEPTADTYPKEINGFKIGDKWRIEGLDREPNHIEKVDWLKSEIEKLVEEFRDYWYDTYESFQGFYYIIVNQYLSEARFWLEFELQRIKETE